MNVRGPIGANFDVDDHRALFSRAVLRQLSQGSHTTSIVVSLIDHNSPLLDSLGNEAAPPDRDHLA